MSQITFEEKLTEVKLLNEKSYFKLDEWILKAEVSKDIRDLYLAEWGLGFLSVFPPTISDKQN